MVLRKLGYEFKRHLSDSTAIVTFFNPLSATLETAVAGMSDMVSLKSRAIAAMLTYGGLANLTKVRDWSKNLFRIGKESSEKTKYLHDALFAGGCVLTIRPMIYLASGETDWKKIAIGTAGITGLNLALGGPAGY
ncbi:MAG: hypothetical protein ABIB47_00020, partial [Candidatus Woesearchaeota archaeon]